MEKFHYIQMWTIKGEFVLSILCTHCLQPVWKVSSIITWYVVQIRPLCGYISNVTSEIWYYTYRRYVNNNKLLMSNTRIKLILIWKLIYKSYLGLFVFYVCINTVYFYLFIYESVFGMHPHMLTWIIIYHLSLLNSYIIIFIMIICKIFKGITHVDPNYFWIIRFGNQFVFLRDWFIFLWIIWFVNQFVFPRDWIIFIWIIWFGNQFVVYVIDLLLDAQ